MMNASRIQTDRPQWRVAASATTPGWIEVPHGLTDDAARSWVEATSDDLRAQAGDHWRAEMADPIDDMLASAAVSRPSDALLDVLYWPYFLPAFGRVRVHAGPSIPVADWVAAGFEVDGYDGAAIGPGIQCIEAEELPVGDEKLHLVSAQYVFDDGDAAVVVVVQPTVLRLFAHMVPGLHGLIGSMRVTRDDGTPFRAVPVRGFTHARVDEWPVTGNE